MNCRRLVGIDLGIASGDEVLESRRLLACRHLRQQALQLPHPRPLRGPRLRLARRLAAHRALLLALHQDLPSTRSPGRSAASGNARPASNAANTRVTSPAANCP